MEFVRYMTQGTPFDIGHSDKQRVWPTMDENGIRQRGSRASQMGSHAAQASPNRLLSRLPANELREVQSHVEEVELTLRQVVHEQDGRIDHAYFPYIGVLSMVREADEQNGMAVEFATIGKEGMAGLPLALECDTMPSMCFCQVPGRAARIGAAPFRDLLAGCPSLRKLLLRYAQVMINQVALAAACNRMHPIEERCARWLLMTHDRVESDHFALTQDFLAQMLGVRRPSVSIAANMLQTAGLIRYSRGLVVITDRQGLEAAACSCYRAILTEFDRFLQ
jgi:CRP-like cAMP-binding protein